MKFAFASKKLISRVFVAVLVLVAAAGSYFRFFELFELQTYDFRCQLRGPRPVSPDIVLVDIADDSLQTLGQWPISRAYHARLIDILHAHGAKAIIFDILFVEPDEERDPQVAAAANRSKRVYFPISFENLVLNNGVLYSDSINTPLVPSYAAVARRIGFVNVHADIDSKRRRTPLTIHYEGGRYFAVVLAAALDVLGVSENQVKEVPGRYLELARRLRLPMDSEGQFLISYAGKWKDTFKHYSYVEILGSQDALDFGEKPMINLDIFKGKIVIVGATALGTYDMNGTPLEPVYYNVGIHANVLNSFLTRDFIRRLPREINLLLSLVLTLIVFLVSRRLTPIKAFVHTISSILLYVSVALVLFYYDGIWMDLACPVFLAIATYLGTTLVKILSEMKKRQQIESELKVASQIQKSFLPERLPTTQGLSLAVYFKPAKAVGGDLYSFIPFGEKKVGVMLGDVSGKGTPAALFMSKVVSEFKFSSRGQTDPALVLTHLNDAISSESTGGLFVTLTYVIFDLELRKLVMTNGGHLPLVRSGANGDTEQIQAEEGMPVGVMEGVTFANFEKPIQAGDCYAFYSDGVSEARNKKKEEFGIEALQAALSRYRAGTASEILKKVVQDLERFMGKADQHDDITLVIAKIDSLS